MKIMQKDPNASDKARKAEQRANEKSGLISIKLDRSEGAAKKGGFKKGGFKSAFGPANTVAADDKPELKKVASGTEVSADTTMEDEQDSDADIGYDYYDPRKPTGCNGDCGSRGS
jgi:hypothetical protein